MGSITLQYVDTIDFRLNFLQGSLPIPQIFTRFFFISKNNFSGELPSSICNLMSLRMLIVYRNKLCREIQQYLKNITALKILDMCHNNLFGDRPATLSFESSLRSFNLNDNKLKGKILQSLANCSSLFRK